MQGIQCATQARIYIGITYTLRGERDPIISFILHFHIVILSSNLNGVAFINQGKKRDKQAGAELCQAGLSEIRAS